MLLHHQFIETAKLFHKKPAYIDRSTGKTITYGQSLIGALLLAKRFRLYPDDHIGILMPTSAGGSLSIIACLFAGKTPVLINYATGAEQNVRFAQQRIGFKTVITSKKLLEKIGCPIIDGMILIEDILAKIGKFEKFQTALASKRSTKHLIARVAGGYPDDTVSIIFTSGSEKDPKGVQLTHRNVYSNLDQIVERFKFTSADRMLAILPIFHVFGFTVCFWLPIHRGMTAIAYSNPLDVKTVVSIMREEKPTIFVGTPYFLASYVKQSNSGDFDSFHHIVTGADKTPDWLHQMLFERHGKVITEGYGATETSPVISVNPPGAVRRGSIGKPLHKVELRIVDVDTGEPLPPGKEGKILVKGDIVMKGYFGEQTHANPQNGWYDTGDMGVLDEDGYLWHRGRLKRFVKVGGEMVSLTQVELAAEKILPENTECCVVEIPDDIKGAQLVMATTQPIDTKWIKDQLLKSLPPIAVPKHYVVINELPKMGSGKIDFRKSTLLVRDILAKTRAAREEVSTT